MSAQPHAPVMLADVLEVLRPGPGRLLVDGTFGAGGYSAAFLLAGATVVAFDHDPAARGFADALAQDGQLRLQIAPFSTMAETVGEGMADGVALDLGVSSMQLDEPARGFSLMRDGPLDMRMGAQETTAADLVNDCESAELVSIFRQFGEEPQARRIALAIVRRREQHRFERTLDLAQVVERAVGGRRGAKTFIPPPGSFRPCASRSTPSLPSLPRD